MKAKSAEDRLLSALENATRQITEAIDDLRADLRNRQIVAASKRARARRDVPTDAELCEDGLVTFREAAAILRVSVSTVERMVYGGRLTRTRVADSPRIPRAAIAAYLAANVVRGRDE